MQFVLIGVLLLHVVLLGAAAEIVWCKFVEKNGKQTFGFYCNASTEDAEFDKQQPPRNYDTNFIPFTQLQPNLTNVTQLKFHKCAIDFVREQCKKAENLNALDISYSNYDRSNFVNWPSDHLKTLNASHNCLQEISSSLFSRTSKIIDIDFSYNNIQRIEATTFANAPQLTRVNLANNNLTTIGTTAFSRAIHLQWIDLSRNKIRTLESLQNNRRLQVIRAVENPIWTFSCDHFVKMDTISVYISWDQVRRLDLACKKSTIQFRALANGTNEVVTLHQNVIAQSNDSEIQCTAGSMTQIERCTIAGRNRVKNITQLLQCFGTKFERLILVGSNCSDRTTATALQRFTELEWLKLAGGALTEFDFRTVQRHYMLQRLDLSQNHLGELQNVRLLAKLNALQELNIAQNQIKNVKEILENLNGSVLCLDLTDNFVGSVNESTFRRLEHLTDLNLSNTSLVISGDRNPFYAMTNLTIFDLSENYLNSMDFIILANTLRQLTRFSATNCHLTNATDIIQYFSGHLLELDLSGNDFAAEKFSADTFKRLTKLQSLYLNSANLRAFNFDWLQLNRKLRTVKLSNNKLHSIEMAQSTAAMVNLNRLDLDGNDLSHLNDMKRSMVPALKHLAISKNRFECNYLIRLQDIFNGIKFSGEPLQHQKHGQNCYLKMIHAAMNERKIYAIGILASIVIVSVAMGFVTWYFCCRKPKLTRNEQILKKIRQSMRDSEYFVPNIQTPDYDDVDDQDDADQCGADEYHGENTDIYDTISLEKHTYDQLHFDTDPIPFNDNGNEHYLHIGLVNGQILSRNVTSRL